MKEVVKSCFEKDTRNEETSELVETSENHRGNFVVKITVSNILQVCLEIKIIITDTVDTSRGFTDMKSGRAKE